MVKTPRSKTCRRQCRSESCRGHSWKFRAAAASHEQRPGNYNHRPLHNSAIMVVICVDARGQDEGYLLGLGMCVCVCVSESLAHADRNHDSYIYIFALALRPTYLQTVGLSFAFMGALGGTRTRSLLLRREAPYPLGCMSSCLFFFLKKKNYCTTQACLRPT